MKKSNLNLERLIRAYKVQSDYRESSSRFKKSAYRTLKVLGGRDVFDAKTLIKVYYRNSDYHESSLGLSEAVCKTLKVLGGRDVFDAEFLIKNINSDYYQA